jgi:hypothetical protein
MFSHSTLGFAADAPALHVSCSPDDTTALVTRGAVILISDGEDSRAVSSVALDARHGGGVCIAFHPSGHLFAVLVRDYYYEITRTAFTRVGAWQMRHSAVLIYTVRGGGLEARVEPPAPTDRSDATCLVVDASGLFIGCRCVCS